jgi:excinuclease UvrABC nuclease subunit
MDSIVKWLSYEFHVYTPDTSWNDIGGIYIFTGISQNKWIPYYIGQTDSFKNRPLSSHEQWDKAQRLGATHIHAMVVQQEATRLAIEKELIQAFQPKLNQQLKTVYQY